MYINKFITFTISALLECAGGAAYAFSLYSPALKESLQYTQVQIQGIANPLVLSLIAGIIPGWAYDTLQRHNRLGPRLILLLGGFIHFIGYVGLWAVGTHIIPQPHYWVVVSLGVIAMNGATWTDVACVSANVRSFPMDRGTAIGILKSMMGLSASVFTVIYAVTIRPHSISFILVIALFLPVLSILAFPFFNAVPFRQKGELASHGEIWSNGLRFGTAYTVIGLLGVLMLLISILNPPQSLGGRLGVLIVMVAVLVPLFFLPLGSGGFWAKPALEGDVTQPSAQDAAINSPLLESDVTDLAEQCEAVEQSKDNLSNSRPDWPLEMTPKQSLSQLNFWLLYFIFGIGSACGLLFLNNAGQLVQSLEGPPDGQDPLLALFSVFNCFGRLLFGCMPEYSLHRWGTPRTAFLVAVSASMALVTLLTAVADVSWLWLTAPISGAVYGAHWSLIPALASEFFGLSHFGFNYCLLGTSITVMSFSVSNMMGGYVYQARLEEHGDKNNICIGNDCFRATFVVAACLEVCITVAAFVLHRRTQYLYAQEQREILKEAEIVSRCPDTGHRLIRQGISGV